MIYEFNETHLGALQKYLCENGYEIETDTSKLDSWEVLRAYHPIKHHLLRFWMRTMDVYDGIPYLSFTSENENYVKEIFKDMLSKGLIKGDKIDG